MNTVIFAGGTGTRLWPVSRKSKPKQFLKLVGENTLLQQTYKRMRKGFPTSRIFIATSSSFAPEIKKQLPQIKNENLSLEPCRKNRGPALGLAAITMRHRTGDEIFATAWSDDHIKQEDIYIDTIKRSGEYIDKHPSSIIAIGITPKSPNTSFRYLMVGKKVSTLIYNVAKFTDKPDTKSAKKYFESGKFLINSGYFVTSVGYILSLYQKYQPLCYKLLMEIEKELGTRREKATIERIYPKMPSFDFEEIFMGDPANLLVSPGAFDWADIGRWGILKDIQSTAKENLIKGKVVTENTTGSLVFNYNPNQLVAVMGKQNLVVVVTDEAILIADKEKTDELKNLIDKLSGDQKLNKYL